MVLAHNAPWDQRERYVSLSRRMAEGSADDPLYLAEAHSSGHRKAQAWNIPSDTDECRILDAPRPAFMAQRSVLDTPAAAGRNPARMVFIAGTFRFFEDHRSPSAAARAIALPPLLDQRQFKSPLGARSLAVAL